MINRHPALKGLPDRFFIYFEPDYPYATSGKYWIAERKSEFGLHLWKDITPKEEKDIPKAEVKDIKEDISDFRSWLYLEGINDFLEADSLEDIDITHENGDRIIWKLDSNGRFQEIRKYNNGKIVYWATNKMVYDNNASKRVYKNSAGVHTETFKSNGKTVCNWLSGKPSTTKYGKNY